LVLGGATLGGAALAVSGSETGVVAGAAAGLLAGVGHHVVRRRERARRRAAHARAVLAHARSAPSVHQVAAAVADALREVGLAPVGADAVRTSVDPDGTHRARLVHVDEEASRVFATAVEEALGPVERPRYLVSRRVLGPPPPAGDPPRVLRRAARGEVDHDGEVWHPVPAVLGSNADRAGAYARAWARWAGGEARALWTGSPEGTGVLAAQHGSDPFRVSSVLRRHWG
ncbi:DEAD/DEAH box helicase, partial [Nocardioides sp. ChNu-99]|nr:DEAD/DEAH box helicase [Nocardioides sp. ChNu-99]